MRVTFLLAAALAAFASPAHAQATFANYMCDDGSYLAVMSVTTTRALYVQLDGHSHILPQRPGLRVTRYSKDGVSVVLTREGVVTLKRPRASTTTCRAS